MLLVQQPAWAELGQRGSTVLLSVAAPPGETEALEAVARELLARLDMQIEVRRVPRIDLAELRRALEPGERYFARVWITLSPEGRARLYLEHGASDRILVREIAGDANNPELTREELGHILQTAVDGLKAGAEVGAPRSDALKDVPVEDALAAGPEKAPPEPAGEAPRTSAASSQPLRFGLRYELSWLGDGPRFQDGPGAVFALDLRPVGFELSAFYRRPLKVDGTPVGVRLEAFSPRALVTLEAWRSERSGIRLGAGAGADIVSVSPLGEPAQNAEFSAGTWLNLAVARLQASYAWRASSFLALELTAGIDVDVNDTRYVFQQSAGETSVLDPSPVRPFVSLGAAAP
ncbi:MAG TPA: hypothetical protein VGK73_00560 [Polyangiaceae bacterium]